MCDPVSLTVAAAAVSSIGSVVGGFVAKSQADYQAKVAEANAANERENITLEQERGNREALLHYRRAAQLKGEQRATAAANGVSTDFGTAQDIVTDTNTLAREDAANIYGQTFQNVRGMDRTVANFEGEASAQRAAGKGALIGSFFEAGSTMLGGAGQFNNLKSQGYGGGAGNTRTGKVGGYAKTGSFGGKKF